MTSVPVSTPFPENKAAELQRAGLAVLRYGLVFLLLMWGALKFTALEAEGIRPLISESPLLSWSYAVFSVRGVSNGIGVIELGTALAMASRRWSPRISGFGSLLAAGTFIVTLSFLVTTPGVLDPTNAAGGFLMKDLLLLGAALFTAGEAFLASRAG